MRWWRTRRFYQQCAELAYKKHQLHKMGNEGGNVAIVERLRIDLGPEGAEIPALSAKADPVLAELWDNKDDARYDRA